MAKSFAIMPFQTFKQGVMLYGENIIFQYCHSILWDP